MKFTGVSSKAFNEIKDAIAGLPINDRRFQKVSSEWIIKYNDNYVAMLRKFNFDIATTLYNKWKNCEVDVGWKDIVIPEEYLYAFLYQQDTLKFLKYHNFNALLALDCGLGKTLISLIALDWLDKFPVLIVAPTSVKFGWLDEYMKFINKGDKVKFVNSSEEMGNYNKQYDIVITSYGIYPRNMDSLESKNKTTYIPSQALTAFKQNKFRMVIIDESHKLGGEDSKTAEALMFLTKNVRHIISSTGTPFLNSPKEMFNTLHMHRPKMFPNRFSFLNRYCIGTEACTKQGRKQLFNGASNSAELHDILVNNVMIRFLKKDVLKDLPEAMKQMVSIPLSDRAVYDQIYLDYEKYITNLKDKDNNHAALKRTNDLRQEIYQQKKDGCFAFVDNLLEQVDKIVLFAHHTKVVADFMERYGDNIVKIDGSCSPEERNKAKKKFMNNKKTRIIIGNMKSMGEGVDGLQRVCSVMCFIEFPWHPGMLKQCIDRLVRIGQASSVLVYLLMAMDSIDNDFFKIIDRKQRMSDEVIDGRDVDSEEYALTTLNILIKRIKRKAHRRIKNEIPNK